MLSAHQQKVGQNLSIKTANHSADLAIENVAKLIVSNCTNQKPIGKN
jgi:hypothetical protein